jgi:MHS family proline/betaine transporter-like MFS transporter
VPFVFGLLVGPVGLYIRMRMDETPEFARADKVRSPLWQTLSRHTAQLLTTAAVVGLASISVYLILFMPTFAVKSLGLPGYAGYLGGMISGLVTLVGVPFVGTLADRVGPAPVMRVTAVAAIVLPWPLFKILLDHPSVATLTVVQIVLGVLMAFYFGPLPALMSDLFPVSLRSTGLSVSYNLGVTLFGGFAPTIVEAFIHVTGDKLAPSYYVLLAAVLSGVSLAIVAWRMRAGRRAI